MYNPWPRPSTTVLGERQTNAQAVQQAGMKQGLEV